MYSLDLNKENYPIIIKPNLGQPVLINLRDFQENTDIRKPVLFEGIIIAIQNQSAKEILEYFHSNVFIQPILKDEGEFSERRGERYPLKLKEIQKIEKLDFRDQGIIEEENCIVWDIYNSLVEVKNIFGQRKSLYKIIFEIALTEIRQIKKILTEKSRSFLLFDIVHAIPNKILEKINYHSIAIFDKDWANIKFIHATDLHIARRNDFISLFLKKKANAKVFKQKKNRKAVSETHEFLLKRHFEFKEGIQKEKIDKLKYGRYNFNQNLRLLIDYVNMQVEKNDVDFVILGGDLIDYIDIARDNHQYKNNYFVFLDILLGINRGLDKKPFFKDEEFLNKREILAPIFTIVGNHDYRKGHYSLRAGKVRKVFGMKYSDIIGYFDKKIFNYFKALRSRDRYLTDYFHYFNPNLNYMVKIGNINYIFLHTGPDSIADLHDLLSGSPSTKGLKDYQIDLLRSYIKLSHDKKIVVTMHTPPISPALGTFKKFKLRRKLNIKGRKLEWSDFYEYNLKKSIGTGRLETILNLKYQTIMYNWATLLRILTGSDDLIQRKVDLIFCGHTHTLKEFRLKEAKKGERANINLGFYISPIYINVPCEVYAGRYSDNFNKFRDPFELKTWFDVNKPFIFQTQGLGPLSLHYKFKPPGFRLIIIKNNRVSDVKTISIHLSEKDIK